MKRFLLIFSVVILASTQVLKAQPISSNPLCTLVLFRSIKIMTENCSQFLEIEKFNELSEAISILEHQLKTIEGVNFDVLDKNFNDLKAQNEFLTGNGKNCKAIGKPNMDFIAHFQSKPRGFFLKIVSDDLAVPKDKRHSACL